MRCSGRSRWEFETGHFERRNPEEAGAGAVRFERAQNPVTAKCDARLVGRQFPCVCARPPLRVEPRRLAGEGHEDELAVVAHPGAGLVGGSEALEFLMVGVEEPAGLGGLDGPVGVAPGVGDEREAVSGAEAVVRVGSGEDIDEAVEFTSLHARGEFTWVGSLKTPAGFSQFYSTIRSRCLPY